MLVCNETRFLHGAKVTSRRARELEMSFVVRACLSLVHDGVARIPDGEFEGDFRPQGLLSGEQHPTEDDLLGAPIYPGDFADYKPNAEVMLWGTCWPGMKTARSDVRFSVGEWSKSLYVFGDRAWSDRLAGAVMSEPLAFESTPIGYESAFGGEGYGHNPVGRGMVGNLLPNLEHPAELVKSPRDRPSRPAGFGPLNSMWAPRKDKLGTKYGGNYARTRAPFYAEDFDWTYFSSAPADQQLKGWLRGDEDLAFMNLHPRHRNLRCKLPGIGVRVFYRRREHPISELTMVLDTLFADLDKEVVYLTWRGLGPVKQDDLTDVSSVLVAAELPGEGEVLPYYRAKLEAFEADPRGAVGLEADRLKGELNAGLSRLDATAKAMEALGQRGDDKLHEDVERLVLARGGTKESATEARTTTLQLVRDRREQDPNGAELSEQLRASQPKQRIVAPSARVMPSGGSLPASPNRPLFEALEAARAPAAEADAAFVEQPGEARSKPSAMTSLDAVDAALAAPALAGLRPPAFAEPGPERDLSRQDYRGWDLRNRDLRGADLREAILASADLRGANLEGANLAHAVLYGAQLDGARLARTRLHLTNLGNASAVAADLSGADLATTFFDATNLTGAKLDGVTGNRALFRETQLAGATFHGAKLFECLFQSALLRGTSFRAANLCPSWFIQCELDEASFEDAQLERSSFLMCSARRARFVGARGKRVVLLRAELEDADFSYAILPSAFLDEASAKGAQFFGADLRNARFYRATLTRASFARANLFRADLRKTELTDVNMKRTNLFEASLLDAVGLRSDFTDANLVRARTPQ